MLTFHRIYKTITNDNYNAFMFDLETFESELDYVHASPIILKTIFIPDYNIYAHYYENMKKFIVYNVEEEFKKTNTKFKNIKEITLKPSFVHLLLDIFETDEEIQKLLDEYKEYYKNI